MRTATTSSERAQLERALLLARELKRRHPWRPLPGPQTQAYESTADVIGYGGAAGGGKGLALDTLLPTPTGWVQMGDVAVGDTLFDEQGQPCQVTALSEINHRACFRLLFDDGSVIVADDVHRWVTFDTKELAALTRRDPEWKARRRANRPSRAAGNKSAAFTESLSSRNSARAESAPGLPPPTGTLRDTRTLRDTLLADGRRNHAIPVAAALAGNYSDLPIPPYTLGAWLGDGTARNGQLTSVDPEIWQRIEADGFEVRHYEWDKNQHSIIGLKVKLRDVGVLENKRIPMQYLRASVEQRLALLQGLMDTDGHAAIDGGCEFDGICETLVDDVLELARSLGIKATKQVGTAKLNGREIGPKYRIKFTTSLPVFHLPRKLCRLRKETRRTSKFRYLIACDPVDSVPTRCLSVDSSSRQYLAGEGMIPTHNTDLACGKALSQHSKVMILRREATQLTGIIDRFTELLGGRDGYNGADRIWRLAERNLQIEFGSVPNAGDETKYQGRPHDLLVFDEAANFLESQIRFLLGWLRTTTPGQRCQALLTFNPPTTSEGRWIIDFFAPWLDRKHPVPAEPGELRWFATVDGEEIEMESGEVFVHKGEVIKPMSRTFIPSRVSDNPYLVGTGYMATLQALPEPLRSQMLYGDFFAGMEDDPWQVIPTAWVEAAMDRWKPRHKRERMDSLGVDVARGGRDNTIIARRHGAWYDEPLTYPGTETPDGPKVAGLTLAAARDRAPIHIDVIGVGSSPYDFLVEANQHVLGVNVAEAATATDRSGRLQFFNLRSQLWWQFREDLDPQNNVGVELPPDKRLLADLCAPKWELRGNKIKVEGREEILKRIGRSPDWASAYVLARIDTPRVVDVRNAGHRARAREYDPYAVI